MSSLDADDIRWRPPWWLGAPSQSLRFRTFCRVFALGTAMRLILPDATQDDWLWVSALHWVGAALVAYNGCLLGWLACAVAGATALFTLEDQLTKSVFMLGCALGAIGCFMGTANGRRERIETGLPLAVRCLTVLVYALAVLHKLNRQFLDPAFSCANGGLELMLAHFPPSVQSVANWSMWPLAQVVVELGIVVLLVLRPGWGLLVAAVMHLPLTIIFAPAFVFVMMSGWVCFYREVELRALWNTLRRWGWPIGLLGILLGLASRFLFFPERWATDPDWCIEEVLLWAVVVWLLAAMFGDRSAFRGRLSWSEQAPASSRLLAATLSGALLLNGLTPYLGLQFHHTAAMLSNLRIDAGCHNSLIFPEAMRISDPYVRIDRIDFAAGRAAPGVAEGITQRLWGPEALWEARAAWCAVHREPLAVAGQWHGKPYEIENLCTDWPFGAVWLPGFRRFQVNLARECPQRCVH